MILCMEKYSEDSIRIVYMEFHQWRTEISPLWVKENNIESITTFLNGFGQIQYAGRELFSKILIYPLAIEINGARVGWTSCYNISDTAIRIRGIYILDAYRNKGLGRRLVEHAMSIWPKPWNSCFMYSRESNIEKYKRWGFYAAPNHQLRSYPWGYAVGENRLILVMKKFNQ